MYNVSVKIKRRGSVKAAKRMPLYVQIIYLRETRKIPLPYKVSEKEWDNEKEEVHISRESTGERNSELLGIREQLAAACRTIRSAVQSLQNKQLSSADEIVAVCRERLEVSNLTNYVDKQIRRLLEGDKPETARHYRSTLNSFLRFRGGCDLRLDEIDAALLKEFETYLFNSGLCANTVSFYLRILRTIRNQAAKDGLVEPNPLLFNNVYTGIEKTRKRAVEEKVILELVALQLLFPELSLARDLFLFSYYARGMAFVDLAHLRRENLQGNRIVYIRRKTGQRLEVRLLPVMKQLLARYRGMSGPYLFPVLKSAVPSYHEYTSALRLQNKRLKKLGKFLGIDLSTYIARHTWASVAVQKGISEELVSKGMGHESVKTTRIYTAFPDMSQVDRANEIVIYGRSCKSKTAYRVAL